MFPWGTMVVPMGHKSGRADVVRKGEVEEQFCKG